MSTGWYFRMALSLLLGSMLTWFLVVPQLFAQMGPHIRVSALEHGHQHSGPASGAWEGSAEGVAYSERNHHIAGLLVMLMGIAELSHVMRLSSLGWARLLLPSAMLFSGLFVIIWSDHEAWPIGSLSFNETFFGHDPEILQHKIYGFMALGVGSVELFRRLGRMGHRAWASVDGHRWRPYVIRPLAWYPSLGPEDCDASRHHGNNGRYGRFVQTLLQLV